MSAEQQPAAEQQPSQQQPSSPSLMQNAQQRLDDAARVQQEHVDLQQLEQQLQQRQTEELRQAVPAIVPRSSSSVSAAMQAILALSPEEGAALALAMEQRRAAAEAAAAAPSAELTALASRFASLSAKDRELFTLEVTKQDQPKQGIKQEAATAEPAKGPAEQAEEHKEQQKAQQVAADRLLSAIRPPASSLSSAVSTAAPASSSSVSNALLDLLDPARSLFRLDVSKAYKAPKLQSQQQYQQWRQLFASFLQCVDVLDIMQNGSNLISLPATISTQQSRTAALPLIEEGTAIGPPGKDAERSLDRKKLLFAHTALMHACGGVPLAQQAVASVPTRHWQQHGRSWRQS